MNLEDAQELWLAEKGWEVNGDVYVSHKLMFHYALLVNPNGQGYEQRYCYKDLITLIMAMEEFIACGKLRHWHKDHTKNISVKGMHLYPAGMLQEPKYSIGEVDWVII